METKQLTTMRLYGIAPAALLAIASVSCGDVGITGSGDNQPPRFFTDTVLE